MIRVDIGGGVDLQTVVVLASVLKQTVHGVQHLMRQQEEPLSENRTSGQTAFKYKWTYQLKGCFVKHWWFMTERVIQEDAVVKNLVEITWPHLHNPILPLQGK